MKTAVWIGKQLLRMAVLLAAVTAAVFILLSISPIDPLTTNVGQTALGSMSPEQVEKLQAYWGVGVPPAERFLQHRTAGRPNGRPNRSGPEKRPGGLPLRPSLRIFAP